MMVQFLCAAAEVVMEAVRSFGGVTRTRPVMVVVPLP